MSKGKQIVGINGYTLGVHGLEIAASATPLAPFRTGPLAALTKRNVPGKMKKPHSKCGSDLIGVFSPRLCPSGGTGRRASFRS